MKTFVTDIQVNPCESDFLLAALQKEIPSDNITYMYRYADDFVADVDYIRIETKAPLSLAQRRFLTACGLSFTTSAVENAL